MEVYSDVSSSGYVNSSFLSVSDSFSEYTELKSLGFNRIFKAKRYGKWYILKGLKPEYYGSQFYTSLLMKEFDISIMLDHSNIVKVIEKRHDNIVGDCIVMEYIDGVTLKEFLQTPHPYSVYQKIVDELLDAMNYYHGKQIIHRDLKPSNILITNNGYNVKIIDFGLSDTDFHAVLKQPAGSEKYAAPEQYISGMTVDCRADIYALGMILKLIFKEKTPHFYKSIIKKCTREERDARYDNVNAIIKQIKRHSQRKRIVIEAAVSSVLLLAILLLLPKNIENYRIKRMNNLVKTEVENMYAPFLDSIYKTDFKRLSDYTSLWEKYNRFLDGYEIIMNIVQDEMPEAAELYHHELELAVREELTHKEGLIFNYYSKMIEKNRDNYEWFGISEEVQ